MFRCYPQPWQVWLETAPSDYKVIAELPNRPAGEELERILFEATAPAGDVPSPAADGKAAPRPKRGLLAEMQQFMRALSQ